MAHSERLPSAPSGKRCLVNPLDALLAPPALFKRALDDVHDIARNMRATRDSIAQLRGEIVAMQGTLEGVRHQLRDVAEEMAPIQNLAPIRQGIEPLEHSMVAVRESVDRLEPVIADLDRKVRGIEPQLDEMRDSIEPVGDLAEKIPGNRRRRRAG
jgi:predicted  nucleic acid-binding Zn-ribbon protein